ncbi:MAG TPA: glucose 1-dehydrogenase [Myxococcota bacterium]
MTNAKQKQPAHQEQKDVASEDRDAKQRLQADAAKDAKPKDAKPKDAKNDDDKPKPFAGEREQHESGHEGSMQHLPDAGADSYVGHGRLKGKIALITGGDSGIGRAVAIAFAREGADVAIACHRHEDDANETKRLVEAAGQRGHVVVGDIAEETDCARLVAEVAHQFGRIDVLVNNAAYQSKAVERFEDLDGERVLKTFKTNVIAMFNLTRSALPHMREKATVINVASIQAYDPTPAILDYAATKGAIVTFTKGLAQELIKRDIRVNCVAPGPVWTPLITASFDADKIQSFGTDNPKGRAAQPAELAPAFVFLASDEAAFVNGEILGVTGGRLLA